MSDTRNRPHDGRSTKEMADMGCPACIARMRDTLNQRVEAAGYSFPSDWLVDDYRWEIGKRAVDAADAAVDMEAAVEVFVETGNIQAAVDAALGRQSNE